MLRQLHLQVLDLATAREAVTDFHNRVQLTTEALQREGQAEAASKLAEVSARLAYAWAEGITAKSTEELQEHAKAALLAMR